MPEPASSTSDYYDGTTLIIIRVPAQFNVGWFVHSISPSGRLPVLGLLVQASFIHMYPLVSSNAAPAGIRVSSHMPVTISTMLCTSRWPPRRALSTRFGVFEWVGLRVRIVVLAAAAGLGISLAVRILIGTVILSPIR